MSDTTERGGGRGALTSVRWRATVKREPSTTQEDAVQTIPQQLEEQWLQFWQRIGGGGDGAYEWQQVHACYTAPGRYYHTLAHLAQCFAARGAIQETPDPSALEDVLEAMIWFHDAVYIPGCEYNEELSAELAERILGNARHEAFLQSLKAGIRATRDHELPCIGYWNSATYPWFLDIDLSILGQDPTTYDRYAVDIRREYGNVPLDAFCAGRAVMLRGFLARNPIYRMPYFRDRYEAQARANMARELAALEQGL